MCFGCGLDLFSRFLFNYLFYFSSLFFLLVSVNRFSIWFCLELNVLCFIFLVGGSLVLSGIDFLLKYFLLQRLASIMILGRIQLGLGDVLFVYLIWFKIIMPPFHFWVINRLKFVTMDMFYYAIT